jgi:acyl-CoA synthetase (AMP-forming)/AMP-acid ligase II
MANVVDLLGVSDAPALIEPGGRTLSFAELHAQVERVAGGLAAEGLRPGDRVLLLVPMGIDLYISLLATLHLGATAMLVDPSGPLDDILGRYPPTALIGIPKAQLLRLKHPALRGLRFAISTGFSALPHRRLSKISGPVPPVDPGAHPALLTFTTGTTGAPKAIARGHDLLRAQHRVLAGHMPIGPGDVDLPTLPVFLLHSLAGGATCVIPDADLRAVGQVDPEPLIRQIQAQAVSSTSGSPAFFQRLANHLDRTKTTLPGLRHIFVGGARVPAGLIDQLAKVAPNAALHIVYGSTEAEPIAVLDARTHRGRLVAAEASGHGALVGTPVPDIQVRIEGAEGQPGEILVAGPHVNPGYLDDPEADARTKVQEGDTTWHRTGDAGFLDESGELWLVGRVGEDIAGLWPLRAEGAAEQLHFVRRAGLAAVDGAPVIAVELVDAPPDWAALVQRATGARPVSIDEIPLDPRHNAKVDRDRLNALLQ